MEGGVLQVRFVRCPKCRKLLPEVPNVPLYLCGACNTVLQAKQRKTNGGSENSSSLPNGPDRLPSSEPLSNDTTTSSKEQMLPNDLKESDEHQKTVNMGDSLQELPASKQTEKIIEKGGLNTSNEQDKNSEAIQNATNQSPSEELPGSNIVEEPTTGVASSSSTRENISNESLKHWAKVARKNEGFDKKHDPEKNALAVASALERSQSDSSSRLGMFLRERVVSLDSEAFHSVHSWMETEKGALSRSFSKDSKFYDKYKHRDIPQAKFRNLKREQIMVINLVDELRDQLLGLFNQTAKGKRTQVRGNNRREALHASRSKLPYHHANDKCKDRASCECFSCHQKDIKASYDNNIFHRRIINHKSEKFKPKPEKNTVKKHCRPVCSGAPFIICSNCKEVLQLPADFLISNNSMHKLQCGACAKILVYSFRARPQQPLHTPPNEAYHPPTEISSTSSESHNPISYIDRGPSIDISRSTEAEAVALRNSQRENFETRTNKRNNGPTDTKLHKLMGYSSASELLNQLSDSDRSYVRKAAKAHSRKRL